MVHSLTGITIHTCIHVYVTTLKAKEAEQARLLQIQDEIDVAAMHKAYAKEMIRKGKEERAKNAAAEEAAEAAARAVDKATAKVQALKEQQAAGGGKDEL
jgi:hypothetical protein